MEKPMTLCDRCEKQFSCLLNYDGVPCRKNRTVEPTNYDRLISKTPEELAELFMHLTCPYSIGGKVDCNAENKGCYQCWLDWLKQEEEEGER